MGDFEEGKRIIAPVHKPSLKEAVLRTTNSFDSSPLNGKFEMTVQEGYNIQKALNRISKALTQLEEAAHAYLP